MYYIVATEIISLNATLHTHTQHWLYEAALLQVSESSYSSISANIGTMEQLNIVLSRYIIASHDCIQRLRDQFDLLIVHSVVYTMRQPHSSTIALVHSRKTGHCYYSTAWVACLRVIDSAIPPAKVCPSLVKLFQFNTWDAVPSESSVCVVQQCCIRVPCMHNTVYPACCNCVMCSSSCNPLAANAWDVFCMSVRVRNLSNACDLKAYFTVKQRDLRELETVVYSVVEAVRDKVKWTCNRRETRCRRRRRFEWK